MSTYLHEITDLNELISEWDKIDNNGTDLSGIRALCQSDLFYLLVRGCNRVDMLHPFVLARCREVETDPDGYLDLWSREHFKSSIITFGLTVKDILNDPEITIGFFSETATIASKFLIQIKTEFENNQLLKDAFPDILYQNPQSEARVWNTDAIIVKRKTNPKEPTLEAQGLISMKVGAHYSLMIYDDVITANSVSTPEMIKKINDYFELSLSQSKEGGKKRFIGTRYSYSDTYQMMIEREIAIPRIYAATDDGTPDGNPVLFTKEYWEQKKKENNTFNLSCQYLQNPHSGDGKFFDISEIVPYDIRPYKLNVIIIIDPAKSMKKGSCNTAMLVIGIGASKKKYLLDGMIHKMSLIDRWENLKLLYFKWKNDPGVGSVQVGYETYGSGSVDVEYFEEQMRKEQMVSFKIQPLEKSLTGSSRKKDRIERLQPDLNSGSIFFPFETDKNKYTPNQTAALRDNMSYRISKKILYKNEQKMMYDLCEVLASEMDNYPYGSLVDGIDCFSRIYDMEIIQPSHHNRKSFSLPAEELT
jgi:hypothetical protein